MLSTFTKKIIGVEKNIRPFSYRDRTGASFLVIFKGFEPHYQWFQHNQASVSDSARIYCYDRCSVDLALEMALSNTRQLSYISTRNYETVTAVTRSPPHNTNQEGVK
jgi:hypothetical protein